MSVPVKGKIIGYKQLKSKHFQKSSYQEQLAFNAVPLSFRLISELVQNQDIFQ